MEAEFPRPSKTAEALAITILTHLLNNIKDKSAIPALLSHNFFKYMLKKCAMNKKNTKDPVIVGFKEFLTKIATVLDVETEPEVQIAVLRKLIFYPGDLMVERKIGVKILSKITVNLSTQGVKGLAAIYRSIVDTSATTERLNLAPKTWSNMERMFAAQYLVK